MVRTLLIAVVAAVLLSAGCDRPQPTPSVQSKTEAKPAAPAAVQPPADVAQPAAPAPAATLPVPAAAAKDTPKPVPATPPAKPAAAPAKAHDAAKSLKVADTLILPASQGEVHLSHLAHAKLFPCAACHGEATPGKLALTKETAHALCRDCHQAKGKGPTACTGCHKK